MFLLAEALIKRPSAGIPACAERLVKQTVRGIGICCRRPGGGACIDPGSAPRAAIHVLEKRGFRAW
jgi:hypothetical protein